METTLCLASAYEMLNTLRVVDADNMPVDPAARCRPVELDRLRATQVSRSAPTLAAVRSLVAENPQLSAPVHALVGEGAAHRSDCLRIPHVVRGALAPRSLVRLASGLTVSSPEHLFMQASRRFDKLELIWLGCELCATYARHPRRGGGIVPAWPLTSVSRIASYLDGALEAGMGGARKAAGVLRHVIERSASPAETAWLLLVTLPYAMGGRAVPKPEVNCHVEDDRRTVGTHRQGGYSCDACWPKGKLVVEYDGDAYHLDSRRRALDNDKRAALEQLGYRVITVSTGQLDRLVLSDDAALRVARHLGVPNRENSCGFDWQARRSDLRRRLRTLMTKGLDWSVFDRGHAASMPPLLAQPLKTIHKA